MRTADLLQVARRYTFGSGRGDLTVFMSSLSMLGLVLAIALLLTVLSVMNGFDREMRERILSLVPHITVHSLVQTPDSASVAASLVRHPQVRSATPFVQFQGLATLGQRIEAVAGIGLDAHEGAALQRLTAASQAAFLQGDTQGILLGAAVAQRLGAAPGDRVMLIVPAIDSYRGASGAVPAAFTVRGILQTGTELDESLVAVDLAAASQLAGLAGAASGLRVQLLDVFSVDAVGRELLRELPPGYYLTNWTMTHGNLYAAIQLSRRLITVLLLSIIAVAAFNVVSSLVLVVIDKRSDIAILRTLGAAPADVAGVFLMQGGMIGVVGSLLGGAVGWLLAVLVPRLVGLLERALEFRLLNTDVYPVSFIPVDIRLSDFVLVGAAAVVMCLLAACYPALRAARLAPASVLHREI